MRVRLTYPAETEERILRRFRLITERGIWPYDRSRRDLVALQRWANTRLYRVVPWPDNARRREKGVPELFG